MEQIASRIIEFDAGHRVYGHESKCKNFHGHRYKVEIHCTAKQLDSIGRIIDFSKIKQEVGGWVDTNWDHTMILDERDKTLGELLQQQGNKPVFYMKENPTAENMSKFLYFKANELLETYNIKCTKIVLWETPNCFSIYTSNC